MPTIEVQELLKNPDNIEIVRDQLAGILALELLHQHELAEADPDLAAKEDYNVHVYIENDEPWAVQDEDNPFPAINVSFDSYSIDTDDGSNDRIVNGKYYIDCYAAGNCKFFHGFQNFFFRFFNFPTVRQSPTKFNVFLNHGGCSRTYIFKNFLLDVCFICYGYCKFMNINPAQKSLGVKVAHRANVFNCEREIFDTNR